MQEILTQTYYGNTVQTWGTALLIMVGAFLVGKILYWISSNTLRRVTAKTRSNLDDIILDMVEEPIVFAATVAGIWFALATLELPEKLEAFLANAFQALIVLAVAWLITRLLDSTYKHFLVPLADKTESDLDDQLLPIISKGTRWAVWALAIVVALNNAGYNVGALLAGLGIGGLALAMAAKDTVANVFGSVMIFTDRPFTVNDRIRISGFDGTVKEVGVRSVRLQTLAGTVVTIPNSTFTDGPVENVSLEPSRKVVLNLGLTYDTTPAQMMRAMELLAEIAAKTEGLEEDVVISFNAFGDFAMNILFIYYITKGADIMGVQSAMNLAILEEFTSAGLDFAFPTQTIYNIPQGGQAA